MADIDLKTETPDTSLPTTGFLFGADSQASASPSVYSTQTVATTLLGSTSLTGATITADAPVLNLAQTWNNAAVTFTGLKFNVPTDNSASGSLLMDLQVGGSSKLYVRKDGAVVTGAGGKVVSELFDAGSGNTFTSSGVFLSSSALYRLNNDTFMGRRAAANLRLGAADAAAPVAQTLSVQSVVAGTSNTAGANLTITGSQGTGTGAGGSIVFQVAPAGLSGTAQNALATALTIDSTRLATFAGNLSVPAGSLIGTPNFVVGSGAAAGFYLAGGDLRLYVDAGTAKMAINSSETAIKAASTFAFSWTSASDAAGTPDVLLRRDNPGVLALRNGTNAQTFRAYNTWTSFGSGTEIWERGKFAWESNVLTIGTEKGANGGTARALEFQTDGTTRLTIATNGAATFTNDIASSSGTLTIGNIGIAAAGYLAWSGRGGLYAYGDGQFRIRNNADSGNTILVWGSATSSFPALKRSSSTLQARLADDSAFASVQGKLTTDTAYAAGDPTTTGYLVVYDSTGTAYKIPAVAV